MCGIAGLLQSVDPLGNMDVSGDVSRMASTLAHRGPDDSGVWESPDGMCGLAHRRLSILDLSPLGHNPMVWEGGRLAITFNGEIYNFRELRRELEAEGYAFRSKTDTEVILGAYDRWGLDCVHRFAGMFAFALWDEPRRRLWIVRDRFGKKPLYYWHDSGVLRFASELKALRAAGLPDAIDRDALRLYLRYGYVPAPYSIFIAARKLPPGHQMICESGRTSIDRYWDPVAHTQVVNRSDEDAEAELESLLGTAVRQRQIADVGLGAFLSGGIDSSLIVALMCEHTSTRVRTFTIRFDDPEYNEADHAAAIARHLGTDHSEDTCGAREMLDAVALLPAMFDEPFADSSAIPTYLVSRAARRHVTVALSGDGGDELFWGYPRYRYHASGRWALALPARARQAVAAVARQLTTRRSRRIADVLNADGPDSYSRFVAWYDTSSIERLTGAPPPDAPLYRDALERIGHLPPDLQPGVLDAVSYLPDDILTKVDRASMAVSLEVRAPLLDHRVAEFALSLPARQKYRGPTTKWLLRRLLHKRVPKPLVERSKMGFGVPLTAWFRGPLREQMNDYVASHDFEEMGLAPESIVALWAEFQRGVAHRPDLLWQIFTLAAWRRSMNDGHATTCE